MQTTNKNSVQRRHHATILPATRITHAFERAQNEERGILIPYFMCGYPSAAQSIELVLAAATGGADIIELGMPFSDPLADGATIQHAGHVALERGMTVNGCLEIARRVASQCAVPLLFMGYYNPILAYGLERFCQEAAASGVCGFIIPDLPTLVDFSTVFRSRVSLVHGRLYQHIYVVLSPGSVAIRKTITYRWSLASGSLRPSTLLRLQTTSKEQLWAAPWSISSISTRRVNRSKQ